MRVSHTLLKLRRKSHQQPQIRRALAWAVYGSYAGQGSLFFSWVLDGTRMGSPFFLTAAS